MNRYKTNDYTSGTTKISIGRKGSMMAGHIHLIVDVAEHPVKIANGETFRSTCHVIEISRSEALKFLKKFKDSLSITRYTSVTDYKKTR